MARPIKSLSERLAAQEKTTALRKVSRSECLLAAIWLEIRGARGRISTLEQAQMLDRVGFSRKEAAAILGTSAQTIAVSKHRSESGKSADAVGEASDQPVAVTARG